MRNGYREWIKGFDAEIVIAVLTFVFFIVPYFNAQYGTGIKENWEEHIAAKVIAEQNCRTMVDHPAKAGGETR